MAPQERREKSQASEAGTCSMARSSQPSSRASSRRAPVCASKPLVEEDSGMSKQIAPPVEQIAPLAEQIASPAERIGLLGLGIMGSRMAANILKAGYELTVWTHTPGKAERWASEYGAAAKQTPAEVAQASDIVVSMVVDGEQVSSVLVGKNGVIEAAHEQLLCVDMSTIAPKDTRRIGAALKERGVALLDAPVTGSSPRAQAGTLTIMAGGEERDFARAKPLLETMGTLVVHVGKLGQGEMLKLINNSLGAANAA